jgi:hypothetical protein
MKRRSLCTAFASIAIAAGMLLAGCSLLVTTRDSGVLTTRDFDFTDFTSVEVGSAFTVDISPSDAPSAYSVKVTTQEGLFKQVRVVKTGDLLKINLDWPGVFFGTRILQVRITMPELRSLALSGATKGTVNGFRSVVDLDSRISGASTLDLNVEAGDFTGEISGASHLTGRIKSASADIELSGASSLAGDVETGDFVCQASGASDFTGSVKASSTTVRLAGASEIQFTGSGGDLKLNGSGASDAKLAGFSVHNADIGLSGASHADVDAGGRLEVSLSGASKLKYGGTPTLGNRMDITGGSTLVHR